MFHSLTVRIWFYLDVTCSDELFLLVSLCRRGVSVVVRNPPYLQLYYDREDDVKPFSPLGRLYFLRSWCDLNPTRRRSFLWPNKRFVIRFSLGWTSLSATFFEIKGLPETFALKRGRAVTEALVPFSRSIMRAEGHWAESWEPEAADVNRLGSLSIIWQRPRHRRGVLQLTFLTSLYPTFLSLYISTVHTQVFLYTPV